MSHRIERALIAVSDKAGIAEFAAGLVRQGIEVLSTGGTARTLRAAGVPVREVAEHTGSTEVFGGRVKSLHPRIHGGILMRRDDPEDRAQAERAGILPIDLVIVNLYPFERRIAEGVTPEEAIEEIDIGGPAMLRAAAKNHAWVTAVVDPAEYRGLLAELEANGGTIGAPTRQRLALAAFRRTAAYDAAISNWLGARLEGPFPAVRTEQWRKVDDLRYGENPHQAAAWYARDDGDSIRFPALTVHGGKALSYNNLLDAAAAIECAAGLVGPAAVIVKHCLPCGAAERETPAEAFEAALEGDPLSAFGGIVAFTQPVDESLAKRIASPELFFEVIHAPRWLPGAVARVRDGAKWGKSCRILEGGSAAPAGSVLEVRSVPGAVLLQEKDRPRTPADRFETVTERAPTAEERADLEFAWRVVPHVRSNGILLARGRAVVGAGAGQPSRVDSVSIACRKAGERARGAALASDAFFPFPDGIEEAAAAGVTAVVQPGGSVRDGAVIEAANRHGIAMLHTEERHFRH